MISIKSSVGVTYGLFAMRNKHGIGKKQSGWRRCVALHSKSRLPLKISCLTVALWESTEMAICWELPLSLFPKWNRVLYTGPSPGFSSRWGQTPDGEAKKQKGGHIFKIQYWMYAATGRPNVKREGNDFKWGAGHHWPLAGDRSWLYHYWKIRFIMKSATFQWVLPEDEEVISYFSGAAYGGPNVSYGAYLD